MNPFLGQLAVEHLIDLLREAEEARRWKLLRAGEGQPVRSLSLRRRLGSVLRRLWGELTGRGRPRPATS